MTLHERSHVYFLSRTIICMVMAGVWTTLFWLPANALQYAVDIAFRTYLMFVGTVMAHEGTHGHLGKSKQSNFLWGRLALLPCMVPYTNFRKTHRLHHAYTNIPDKDPDYFLNTQSTVLMVLRTLAMPHHWFFWLQERGLVRKKDLLELLLNYSGIFVIYFALMTHVGASRLFWGTLPCLVLVSLLLWYPFAIKTHEGYSMGTAESRSHNYYGRLMYWFSLGLSMHRIHHMRPELPWIELNKYVEKTPERSWKLFPQRDFEKWQSGISLRRIPLQALDLISAIQDSHVCPMNFAVLMRSKNTTEPEALQQAGHHVQNLFPVTRSRIEGRNWVDANNGAYELRVQHVHKHADFAGIAERFVNQPLDPAREIPVQQMILHNSSADWLLTRFHHAAADGISALLWLNHQFSVTDKPQGTAGVLACIAGQTPALHLRKHSSPVRKSAYSTSMDRLWSRNAKSSGQRKWRSVAFSSGDLKDVCRPFTFFDLLSTCVLETLLRWNRDHGCGTKLSLWLPVNIRKQRFSGFGNGSSRIRVYATYGETAAILEKCAEIHRQIRWSYRHGEWHVPENSVLLKLHPQLAAPILRAYLRLPWVDMGSAAFSHMEVGREFEILSRAGQIDCIGPLHPRHPVSIYGVTQDGVTHLTFVYDPLRLQESDVEELIGIFGSVLREAFSAKRSAFCEKRKDPERRTRNDKRSLA